MKSKSNKKTLQTDIGSVLTQIDRSQPLRDQIYAMVRKLILTGVLPPGVTLEEKVIAQRLGVSRTPVHEAVQKLSDEHLVDIKPQSGTTVANISSNQVHQAFLIRRSLESETVFAATGNLTDKNLKFLEDNIQQHQRALEREQYVDAIALDDEFHKAIANIADLPLLWRAITISKAQLDRCRHQTLPVEGYGASTLQQHNEILSALKDRNDTLARQMMQSHLDKTYVGIQKFLEEQSKLI